MAKNVADVMLSAAKIAKIKDKDGEEFYAVFGDYCKNPDSDVAEALAIYCEDKGKAVQSLSDVTYKKMKYSSKLANEAPYVYIGPEYNIVNDGQLNFRDFALQLHKDLKEITDFNCDEATLKFLSGCHYFVAIAKGSGSVESPVYMYGFSKVRMDTGSRPDLVSQFCEAKTSKATAKELSKFQAKIDLELLDQDIPFSEMQGLFNYTQPGIFFDVHTGNTLPNRCYNWEHFVKGLPR